MWCTPVVAVLPVQWIVNILPASWIPPAVRVKVPHFSCTAYAQMALHGYSMRESVTKAAQLAQRHRQRMAACSGAAHAVLVPAQVGYPCWLLACTCMKCCDQSSSGGAVPRGRVWQLAEALHPLHRLPACWHSRLCWIRHRVQLAARLSPGCAVACRDVHGAVLTPGEGSAAQMAVHAAGGNH